MPRSSELAHPLPHWGVSHNRSGYSRVSDVSKDRAHDYPYIWTISANLLVNVDLLALITVPDSDQKLREMFKQTALLCAVSDPVDGPGEENYAHAVVRILASYDDDFTPSELGTDPLIRQAFRLHLATRMECYHAA